MTNSKSIGNNWEREVAKLLSKWFTGSDDELVVWRHVSSGSISTIRKQKGQSGKNVDGDFQCLDSRYEKFFNTFYLDSKSLSDVNLFVINAKNQKSNQLLNEWKKVVNDATNKYPIMIVKLRKNRSVPDFIVLHNNIKFKCNNVINVFLTEEQYNFHILVLDEFLKCNDWQTFLEENI